MSIGSPSSTVGCPSRVWQTRLVVVGSVGFYFFASISLTMFNKWLFTTVSTGATGKSLQPTADGHGIGNATRQDATAAVGQGPTTSIFRSGSKGVSGYQFHFPLTVTCVHQFLVWGLIILLERPVLTRLAGEITRSPRILSAVAPIGVLCGLDWGLSNTALRSITLSLYELIKACSPILVLIISSIFGLQRFSGSIFAVVFVVVLGLVLGVGGGDFHSFTQAGFPMFGFLCVTGATFLSASRIVMAQRVLQHWAPLAESAGYGKGPQPTTRLIHGQPGTASSANAPEAQMEEKKSHGAHQGLNSITVMYYAAPASASALVLPALLFEGEGVKVWFTEHSFGEQAEVVFCVVASSALAMMLSISEFVVTRKTSALTLCIVGISKQVLIVALAMFWFGDRMELTNILGFVLTLTGIALYNYLKLTERRAVDPEPERIGFGKFARDEPVSPAPAILVGGGPGGGPKW